MGLFKPKLNKNIQNRLDTLKPRSFVSVTHIEGLPIAQNILCQLYYCDDKIVIDGSGTIFNLVLDKIQSIDISREVKLNKQLTSSAGGAVAGGLLFGAPGAIVGGRTKEKEVRDVKEYLVITYINNNEIKYISFDVAYTPKAKEFIKLFNQNSKKENIIEL